MGRLIDTDKLLKDICGNECGCFPEECGCDDNQRRDCPAAYVYDSSTAYDVDKVVKDLKECAEAAKSNWEFEASNAYEYAAEIVKRGGIE